MIHLMGAAFLAAVNGGSRKAWQLLLPTFPSGRGSKGAAGWHLQSFIQSEAHFRLNSERSDLMI